MPATSIRRWTLRIALVALASVLADRVAMWALLDGDGRFGGKSLVPFETATFQTRLDAAVTRLGAEGTEGLVQSMFDADIGWAPRHDPAAERPEIDRFGARSDGVERSESPAEGTRRILVFGCSFTYGTEVRGADAWPARLDAMRDDVEVFNFGVAGYGLGQALLRMERVAPALDPDEVWLVLMPSAAERPTTHLLSLARPWTGTPWFKPRFEAAEDGTLVRHANPVRTIEETIQAYRSPGVLRRLLAGRDPWYDRHPNAFARRPLHALFVARLYWTRRLFRTPDETRGTDGAGRSLVPVHRAIALEARDRARAMGATFRYVIVPGAFDLPSPGGDGGRMTEELVTRLEAEGVEVLDATQAILAIPGDERWAPGGHFSRRTNGAVARWLAGR